MLRDAPHPSSTATAEPRRLPLGTIVACPDSACGQAAEIVAAWRWPSTSGPVEHVRTRCLARHVFTPPVDAVVTIADGATPPTPVASRA